MQNSSDHSGVQSTPDRSTPAAREAQRLEAVRSFEILDTLSEQAYEDIAHLASHICRTPIALVTLIDGERQWFKAKVGVDISETPRSWSFCDHAIRTPDQLMLVPDALKDARFSENPLVTGQPHIRFYAGAPLVTSDGHGLGTLCVIDILPRELSEGQQKALSALARQVMAQLELRLTLRENEHYFNSFLRPLLDPDSKVADFRSSTPLVTSRPSPLTLDIKTILDSADLTIISTDLQGVIRTCNAGALTKLGYSAKEIIGKATPPMFHDPAEIEEHARKTSLELKRPLTPGHDSMVAKAYDEVEDENDWTYIRKDGSTFLVRLSITALRTSAGEINGFLAVGKDITQQKIIEESLRETEGRFQAFMDNGPAMTFIKNEDGEYVYVNELVLRLFHKRRDEVIGFRDADLWPPEFVVPMRSHDKMAIEGNGVYVVEETAPMPDGRISYWLSHKFPLYDIKGRRMVGGISIDITDRKEYEKRLEELALTDSLTGLKNHGAFAQRLSEEYERARRYNLDLSVVMLDVDHFKKYNDAFGHLEGDAVLRRMGEMLQQHMRPCDFAARYGGEEFGLILTNTAAAGALSSAERLRRTVEKEAFAKQNLTVSVGVASLHPATAGMNTLITAADESLYEAKRGGRNRVCQAES